MTSQALGVTCMEKSVHQSMQAAKARASVTNQHCRTHGHAKQAPWQGHELLHSTATQVTCMSHAGPSSALVLLLAQSLHQAGAAGCPWHLHGAEGSAGAAHSS
jgi:hypothetical protein